MQTHASYIGSIATATSLSIGQEKKVSNKAGNILADDTISIAEVLSHPKDGSEKLIGSNMVALQAYVSLLQTDIVSMLDQSADRTTALDEHIELLKSAYTRTAERLSVIGEQIADLKAIQTTALATTADAKTKMEERRKTKYIKKILKTQKTKRREIGSVEVLTSFFITISPMEKKKKNIEFFLFF